MANRKPRDAILWFVFFPDGRIANWSGCFLRKDAIKAFLNGAKGLCWDHFKREGYSVVKREVCEPFKITATARTNRD